MEKDNIYNVYDIELNAANALTVLKYVVEDILKIENGRYIPYRTFKFVDAVYPNDIESTIQTLQQSGYIDVNHFCIPNMLATSINPLVQTKLMLLGKNHKLLEKYYQEKVVNNVCFLEGYITYINMKSGEVSTMKVGNYGIYAEEKLKLLENSGYKHVSESYYYQKEQEKFMIR